MTEVLDKYHQILLKENMQAAPVEPHFFLTRVKFFEHTIEGTTVTPLKFEIIAILKPPSDQKKIQAFF